MFHYTSCGLRDVWLANGYHAIKTPYGEAVSIEDLEGLHKALGHLLVTYRPKLTGAEFRFLRKELDMSQHRLAELLGNSEQSVALWEKKGHVPKWADRFIRLIYIEYTEGNAPIVKLVDGLNQLDQPQTHARLTLEDTEQGWRPQAA